MNSILILVTTITIAASCFGHGAEATTGFVSIHRTASTTFGTRRHVVASSSITNPSILVVDEMPPSLPPLKNYYYLLRHGQSTANVAGIISSARSLAGSTKHGLTLLGIQQGCLSAESLINFIAEDLNDNSFLGIELCKKDLSNKKELDRFIKIIHKSFEKFN